MFFKTNLQRERDAFCGTFSIMVALICITKHIFLQTKSTEQLKTDNKEYKGNVKINKKTYVKVIIMGKT